MKTLLVSTTSYAGMGPYVCAIVNSFSPDDPVNFFLVEDEKRYYSKNIRADLLRKAKILIRRNSKWNKLENLVRAPRNISNELKAFCKESRVDAIHLLTNEYSYSKAIFELREKHKILFTVHDLHPHEAKRVFYKQLRWNLITRKIDQLINRVPNLITNSMEQYDELRRRFPKKYISFQEFPSLVTPVIAAGNQKPNELEEWTNYVLFFGRIELYKGIDLLYDVFTSSKILGNKKLVIAGSGELYFKRLPDKEQNIKFINRYIADEEIAYLYRNAAVVVYPYISATQSGVLSLACYFKVPVLASDIPFFKQVEYNRIGKTFLNRSTKDLEKQIVSILKSNNAVISENQEQYYNRSLNTTILKKKLLETYAILID